ncbi:hypothetical protein [Streptomyces sp. AC550_RSS872]|uniref:hypothetical protein n=1 Tax=Streptomyces sp. AC550_RSS872 TaxID=2823689 RepID=UPI001C2735C7|nr:hypothetical protein [Streptomyces sp. AC550_RSS872]
MARSPHVSPPNRTLPLLEREADGHLPFAYEQLAAAYRAVGDGRAACTVQLARLRRHRRALPWYARFWGHLQDTTVGYGFRPLRAPAGFCSSWSATPSLTHCIIHAP